MADSAEITVHRGLFKNVDLYVEDTGGAGRPVVLIHGWPLSGASWSHQVPALAAAGYRVDQLRPARASAAATSRRAATTTTRSPRTCTSIIEALDLTDVTLIGFSMGGGEVARYVAKYGADRIHSVVFASAVPPFLAKSDDNPDGPLDQATADGLEQAACSSDRHAFFPQFVHDFYSANGELKVTPQDVADAVALAEQSDQKAALGAMAGVRDDGLPRRPDEGPRADAGHPRRLGRRRAVRGLGQAHRGRDPRQRGRADRGRAARRQRRATRPSGTQAVIAFLAK